MNMDIRPLRTEADYDWALAEIEQYFTHQPSPGTPEAERFDVLAALIENYETKYWPIEAPDPVEAIRTRMEQTGYTQADLAKLFERRAGNEEIHGAAQHVLAEAGDAAAAVTQHGIGLRRTVAADDLDRLVGGGFALHFPHQVDQPRVHMG